VADRRPTYSGPGRLLVAVYAVFAVSATARAGVQIVNHFDDAPVAYLLSAFAAVLYIVATVALARSGPTARRVAFVACTVELTGVLVIGTASVIWPDAFPDETVWSAYGRGYGFVPLVLPVLGLLWLRRSGGARQRRRGQGERV
jgi:cytochrome bd-type quinol oxidase subunit 2